MTDLETMLKNEEHLQKSVEYLASLVTQVRTKYPDASDIQFVGGDQMWVHENGEEKRTGIEMKDAYLLMWAEALVKNRGGAEEIMTGAKGTLEAARDIAGIRLRMTWRRQYGSNGIIALNTRILPAEPPSIDSPRFQTVPIPRAIMEMILNNRDGLVLVEGPTGSGKSTLLAALIDLVNRTQARHIYTVEDPIEFVHESKKSLVTLREVHTHVSSFHQGLMTSRRSKPGIILLGELRDLETKRAAMDAALEGHLVLATSHASAVPEAIQSFVGAFPSDEQNAISQSLSTALRGIIVQQLIPATNGKVVPVREMVTVTPQVQERLAERQTGKDLRQLLMSSEMRALEGTFSRDDSLFELYEKGLITRETALTRAIAMTDLRARLDTVEEEE